MNSKLNSKKLNSTTNKLFKELKSLINHPNQGYTDLIYLGPGPRSE